MKRCLAFWVILIGSGVLRAQTLPPDYRVGTWPGFRTAAVSFTFDDGSPNQFSVALPLFDTFGFKMTLFTITGTTFGWPPNWDQLRAAAAQGHEVASHTVTHTSLGGLADSLQERELRGAKEEIEFQIPGQPCLTMAYPYCVVGKKSLCAQYYIAARACQGNNEPPTPRDFFNISSVICGELGSIKTTDQFIARYNTLLKTQGWCVFLIHGVDQDGGWSSLSSDVLREALQYLADHDTQFWVATFGDAVRYIRERNALSVVELAREAERLTIQVSDTLDDALYCLPVTIRCPLPEGWPWASGTQDGRPIPVQVVEQEGRRWIVFDAVPDRGEVILEKSTTGIGQVPDQGVSFALLQNFPNPFNPTTTIRFSLPREEGIRISLYTLSGQWVRDLAWGRYTGGTHSLDLDAGGLATGVYLVKMEAGGYHASRRVVVGK